MAFDGTEGSEVTLTEAAGWTAEYRRTKTSGDPNGHFFGKDHIEDILAQTGCMGIRIYYGVNENDEKVLILVGAKANEDDIDSGIIVEKGLPCPNICGTSNSLNS
ncbi:MAG: hypothetical protein EP305_04450 [Bacteroidetes bacterium]|nr:MAG: hypothetical protein EP305_04450 [Bacteroidota bacterium]